MTYEIKVERSSVKNQTVTERAAGFWFKNVMSLVEECRCVVMISSREKT
jgi:hypothetical protein